MKLKSRFAAIACMSVTAIAGLDARTASAGLPAYSDPTDGSVSVARESRTDPDESRKLAFPSARGHGRLADPDIGPGQTFTIHKITNLNDNGPGSFRNCFMATGPRVCIFTVSGTITLTSEMLARDAQSNIYIAGQTSPGGIQIKVGPNNPKGSLRTVRVSDMILRYVKLRPGTDHEVSGDVDSLDVGGTYGTWDTHDVMLDHLSLQWSTDEAAHISGMARTTLQWSIQSEPLRCGTCRDDHHPNHNYGIFADQNESLTLYKNLIMGGYWRNANAAAERLEIVNNVGYNYGQYAMQFYVNSKVNVRANVVGNWYSRGPNTVTMPQTKTDPHCMFAAYEGTSSLGFEFFVDRNVCAHDLTGKANLAGSGGLLGSPVLYQSGVLKRPAGAGSGSVVFSSPRSGGLSVPDSDIVDATQALQDVISFAGARQDSHIKGRLDSVDGRAIKQLIYCDSQSYLPQPNNFVSVPSPGYPDLASKATWSWAGDDTDKDGMLDSWELSFPGITSLNRLKPNGDYDKDGWSDLEEFLNYLAGEHIPKTGRGKAGYVPAAYCGYRKP